MTPIGSRIQIRTRNLLRCRGRREAGVMRPFRLAGAALMAALCGSAFAAGAELHTYATGLSQPIAVVNAGDGSGRLFIAQQGGRIMVHDGSRVLPTPFLDLSGLVTCGCGEQGLLGLAFHPRYGDNG